MKVNHRDWSHFRKGHSSQIGHQEKVQELVRSNLSEYITEEGIIYSSGEKKIKIPIRTVYEPKFRFDVSNAKSLGMGKGGMKEGQKLTYEKKQGKKEGKGKGGGADKGFDWLETEIDIDTIEDLVFDQLELPELQDRNKKQDIQNVQYEMKDIRKQGLASNFDKKRTLLHTLKRNIAKGVPSFKGVSQDDLHFKSWEPVEKPITNAVVFAMMDTSGSMGLWEKYMARTFFHWSKRFLERKYSSVEIVYIGHNTEAKELDEYDFFHRGESGGTICSSAYSLAYRIMKERYPISDYNIYVFHVTDGDNLSSDTKRCADLIDKMSTMCNYIGYVEVNQYQRDGVLRQAFKRASKTKNVGHLVVSSKKGVYEALKHFFRKKESVS